MVKIKIQPFIKLECYNKLSEFLTSDLNSICGLKPSKSILIDLGLKLLFEEMETQPLDTISVKLNDSTLNTETKRIQISINETTYNKLINELNNDSNRINGKRIKKGGFVEIGLKLLFNAMETQSLENIYLKYGGLSNGS